MVAMFSDCSKLTSLTLKNFDTRNVTDMDRMFYFCRVLATLDISSFDTSKVGSMNDSMDSMFGYMPETAKIKVKNATVQSWVLNSTSAPAVWTTANVIIA